MTKLDAEIDAILREADGTDDYDLLMEKWSDAARAASAAARRAKGSGGNWRKAAARAYHDNPQGMAAIAKGDSKLRKRGDDLAAKSRRSYAAYGNAFNKRIINAAGDKAYSGNRGLAKIHLRNADRINVSAIRTRNRYEAKRKRFRGALG